MILYVAGPYRGDRAANIAQARNIAQELWAAGFAVICPHANTALFDDDRPDIPDKAYLQGDLEFIVGCDGLVMTPDWEKSSGARNEHEYAEKLGIPIWVYPNFPDQRNFTKVQLLEDRLARLDDILGEMYRKDPNA